MRKVLLLVLPLNALAGPCDFGPDTCLQGPSPFVPLLPHLLTLLLPLLPSTPRYLFLNRPPN